MPRAAANRRNNANRLRKVSTKIAKTPRARRATRAARRTSKMPDHFIHCVYGPINAPSSGVGAPDGSVEPSVVIDHRQVVTVKPDVNGNITVAIVPSPYGAVAIGSGLATVTMNSVDFTGDEPVYLQPTQEKLNGVSTPVSQSNYSEFAYPLIPFTESLRAGGSPKHAQGLGLQATKFRVLTSMAQADFTGSTMYNSGSAVTAKIAHHLYEDRPSDNPTAAPGRVYLVQTGSRIVQTPPSGYADISSLPGANVFPARQSVMMINAPQSFDYQEMREQWMPFMASGYNNSTTRYFGGAMLDSNGITHGSDPVPGFGYSTVTYYAASGLDASATITFEVRTCVEYTLAFSSPASRFTALPSPERPLAIKAVKEIGRTIPSSFPVTPAVENHGWLSNAVSWYGRTMAHTIGAVYEAGGSLMKNMGPIGSVLGGGAQALGGQLAIM